MDDTILKIIEDARTFYKNRRNLGQDITWSDYEYFKSMLHSAGGYGYEHTLLDALNL